MGKSLGKVGQPVTGGATKSHASFAPHAALLVVQIAFASQAVEAKLAMLPREAGGEAIPPLAIAMARMLVGAAFFQVFYRLVAPKEAREPISRIDHARLLGLSVLGITANQAIFLLGLGRTTPFAAALLSATIPVCTSLLAALFGVEKLSLRTLLGFAVAVAGVLVLTGVRSVDRGALLIAANSLLYSAYLVLGKNTILRLGALRVVTWIFTWGALVFLPFGALTLVRAAPEMHPRGFALVAYILLMPTIVAYSLNAWALGKTSPTLVTVYIYLQPLIAAVLSYVQLGIVPSRTMGLSSVLILAGVAIVAFRRPAGRPLASAK